MASSTSISTEPFIRVRLIRFYGRKSIQSLEQLRLRIDTFDIEQTQNNRPKFPEYDKKLDRFCFETRAKQHRQITINIYNSMTKISYVYQTSIEDLIRHADGVIREYKFKEKGQGEMSVELITSENIRAAQRFVPNKIKKHYGHEFLSKYFMNLPVFCSECRKILWGFGTQGYRCQLCDLVIHKQCINHVANCGQSFPNIPHKFIREPNFLPVFCDHDGRIISPLGAWKCSDCGIIVHSKCKCKVALFCGTRQFAIQMYEEWKEQNTSDDTDTYISSYECLTEDMAENYQKLLINIYQGLNKDKYRDILHEITKTLEHAQETTDNSYYNRSTVFLHCLTFTAKIGQGMSGSVYLVKYSGKDYALKVIRKHRIFEKNEYECVKNERDILITCRDCSFIIQLYAVVHDFQRIYFLFEHASCGNFYNFLSHLEIGLDDQCIQWFSGQIICALRYLHSKLIIHRDLKPENVLLLPNGYIKLADFGFSKKFHSPKETTGTFCGTPEYIAPEIYQHIQYSFAVDCWSLGIMIYEMIMLYTPFYHGYDYEIKRHVIDGDFRLPDRISNDLQMIVSRLLKKNPQERFNINDLQSTRFYSSTPYSLEQLEQKLFECPWKQPIPFDFSTNIHPLLSPIHLSNINEQSLCATLTVNKDQFRNFSFMAF